MDTIDKGSPKYLFHTEYFRLGKSEATKNLSFSVNEEGELIAGEKNSDVLFTEEKKDYKGDVTEPAKGKNTLITKENLFKNYKNQIKRINHNHQLCANTMITATVSGRGLLIGASHPHEMYIPKTELKLGFEFDHTSGLPYIPGPSLKGMFRSNSARVKRNNGRIDSASSNLRYFHSLIKNLTDSGLDKIARGEKQNDQIYWRIKQWQEEEKKYKPFSEKWTQQLFGSDGEIKKHHLKPSDRGVFIGGCIASENGAGFIEDHIAPQHKKSKTNDGIDMNLVSKPIPIKFLILQPGTTFNFYFKLPIDCEKKFGLSKKDILILFSHFLYKRGIGTKSTNHGSFGKFKNIKIKDLSN